jgi:acyl-CoA thioesterase I
VRHIFLLCLFSLLGLAAKPAQAQQPAKARVGTILVVGDSLSAEYGLARGTGWVALLGQQLRLTHPKAQTVNASISGETTAGGRTRLLALLQRHQPSSVILELGANDALRGLALEMTRENLTYMVRTAKAYKARVLLLGMQIPPNYGRQYSADFANIFITVANQENAALVPFLLAGIANADQRKDWFQADDLHPNAAAQVVLFNTVWPVLKRQLGI